MASCFSYRAATARKCFSFLKVEPSGVLAEGKADAPGWVRAEVATGPARGQVAEAEAGEWVIEVVALAGST